MKNATLQLGLYKRFSNIVDDRHWVKISSAKDAVEKLEKYIEDNVFEDWNLYGGEVKVNGRVVASIDVNSRIFYQNHEGNEIKKYDDFFSKKEMAIEELQKLIE